MVEVRFACIPSVPGVKCTLDGVVKYSDEIGICSFFGISQGAHSYSIVAPEGRRFVSGDDVFGRPLYESGTTVIEWMLLPGTPWPESQPWMLKFVFEKVALGEFVFDSWNPPLDTREVFPAGAPWPSTERTYKEGDTVYIHYCVKNIGTAAGRWTITIKDLDTGATIATWSGNLDPGYRFKTVDPGANLGKMPAKNWRLEFKVTP